MSALQLLADCPGCGVACAVVELVSGGRQSAGACRLCGLEVRDGRVSRAGRRFAAADEVEAALAAWAAEEGESLSLFVEANFCGLTVEAVVAAVLAGAPVNTSFDVVAWLFRARAGGMVALGGPLEVGEDAKVFDGDRGAFGPPVTPPRARPTLVPSAPRARPPEPSAATRALVATALADGLASPAERALLDRLCDELGAPRPLPEEWRAWRPMEVGVPPDPVATVAAMRRLALADEVPDPGEARVIREFARAWWVPVPEPVLPPVTVPQKLVAGVLELFGR